jgi:hypothetical protein
MPKTYKLRVRALQIYDLVPGSIVATSTEGNPVMIVAVIWQKGFTSYDKIGIPKQSEGLLHIHFLNERGFFDLQSMTWETMRGLAFGVDQ